jgi:hypothetical protein
MWALLSRCRDRVRAGTSARGAGDPSFEHLALQESINPNRSDRPPAARLVFTLTVTPPWPLLHTCFCPQPCALIFLVPACTIHDHAQPQHTRCVCLFSRRGPHSKPLDARFAHVVAVSAAQSIPPPQTPQCLAPRTALMLALLRPCLGDTPSPLPCPFDDPSLPSRREARPSSTTVIGSAALFSTPRSGNNCAMRAAIDPLTKKLSIGKSET